MEKLTEIKDITVSYETKKVLTEVSLDLWENDVLGITGPNGGGKTTLLKVILGLQKPALGKISFFDKGKPVEQLRTGYLPQVNETDHRFPISVYDTIASGLVKEKPFLKDFKASQKERINDLIAQMELEPFVKHAVGELSGGQLQRVFFARALISRPQLLVLDEPNTYIDKHFEQRFYDLLLDENKKTAIIIVSHDMPALSFLVKNVAFVNETLSYHSGTKNLNQWLEKLLRTDKNGF